MIAGAEATDKAAGGQLGWLRSECRDGKAGQAERPLGESGRGQSLHRTDAAVSGEKGG